MLDLKALKLAITERDVQLPELATYCNVSAEELAGWLTGEIIPRPNKLQALCEFLGLSVNQALRPTRRLKLKVAYEQPVGGPADGCEPDWVADIAGCLMTLAPLARLGSPLAPPQLHRPSLNPDYVTWVAEHFRRMGKAEDWGLMQQLQKMGVILIPLLGNQSSSLRGSASFHHVDSGRTFVTVNLGASAAEIRDSLAFHLGACLAFPCTAHIAPVRFAKVFARAVTRDVPVTLDPAGIRCGLQDGAESFVTRCLSVFGSCYLETLAKFQSLEGGRNPAFVQLALQSSLLDAVDISFALLKTFEFDAEGTQA